MCCIPHTGRLRKIRGFFEDPSNDGGVTVYDERERAKKTAADRKAVDRKITRVIRDSLANTIVSDRDEGRKKLHDRAFWENVLF